MKRRHTLLLALAMLGAAAVANADPTIGVFFDTDGSQSVLVAEPGTVNTGYILINNADMMVGGAAFKMETEGGFMLVGETWADGLLFGTLLTGAEIGLYTALPQFGTDPTVICTFQLFGTEMVINSHLTIVNDPDYATPVVANNNAILFPAEGLTGSVTLRNTPEIGVFFDAAATEQSAIFNGGVGELYQAWVCVRNAEMMVGGAAFKMNLDPRITLLNAVPANALIFGTLTTGVEMGLYTNLPVFGSDPGILYSLLFTTFNNQMIDATIAIVNHPNYDTPKVADNSAVQWTADGLTSFLTIPVATEEMSWGQVKALY
ncbi:MAG: hypothetical protein IPH09_13745 [bacterium]|nr:hypothetical protein [bacterium]